MIKRSTIEALQRYYVEGIEPGHFLCAVLGNNLMESLRCADEENRASLLEIVWLIYNEMPKSAWGSELAIASWMSLSNEVRAQIVEARRNATPRLAPCGGMEGAG
jgi:hypothetical protein